MLRIRIHGDNILEAERAAQLVAAALRGDLVLNPSPLYCPVYEVVCGETALASVELVPGHDHWGMSIQRSLQDRGATLREAADAMVTVATEDGNERVVVGFEFCNALPAGNQAWQRHGRALASAQAGVPYLFVTEIGGMELDADRQEKAGRLPNPIIPFSYVTATLAYEVPCLPVYTPSPSSSEASRRMFASVYGDTELVEILRRLLLDEDCTEPLDSLRRKAADLTEILARERRGNDSFTPEQWGAYADAVGTVEQQEAFLTTPGVQSPWRKRITIPVRPTITRLLESTKRLAVSAGAHDFPICIVPESNRPALANALRATYGKHVDSDFSSEVDGSGPLIVVWIAGFKPRGDDSRPDRGLLPLARMLFGPNPDVLAVVYGPARPAVVNDLEMDPALLAERNGLWEAIIGLSDFVLLDSLAADHPAAVTVESQGHHEIARESLVVSADEHTHSFSEQDVDSVLHMLFTAGKRTDLIFECLCNPPGGDWSGMSYLNGSTGQVVRWTSLPRVTAAGQKRPDHVVEILGSSPFLIAIESKDTLAKLDPGVGPRLTAYTSGLLDYPPNVTLADTGWTGADGSLVPRIPVFSASAVCWAPSLDMAALLERGETDLAIALEFLNSSGAVMIHLRARSGCEHLVKAIAELAEGFGGWVVVQED